MRKYVLYLALLAGLLTGCYNEEDSREHVLKVYNWADYIGEGVLEDFQQYYKEQTEKRSGSFIRPLISMKSC